MSETASTRPAQTAALAHIVRRLHHAAEPAWLHGEVARRMAERLSLIRLRPLRLVDWWSFNGASAALLRDIYPKAHLLCVEADASVMQRHPVRPASAWWSPWRRATANDASVLPQQVPAGDAGLVWANMMLHLVEDPQAVLMQWQRALALDGFVMFSTLGPGSLQGLRAVYDRLRWPAPFAPFVDMHDLGDMLVRCGFADPVMDQEIITLTWQDAVAMLAELRGIGGNAHEQRFAGLRTPRWRQRLHAELQALKGGDGRLRLDFEVVYGHAFKAMAKPRVASQTTVGLDQMRAMVRAPRRGGGSANGLR